MEKVALSGANVASFMVKHYKPILGAMAAAYIVNQLMPIHDFISQRRQERSLGEHSELLKQLVMNTNKPIEPKKDNYIYSF